MIKEFINKLLVRRKKVKKSEDTFRGECEMCFNPLRDIGEGFCCKYCGLWHCLKHRLPEDHQCSGNPVNPH